MRRNAIVMRDAKRAGSRGSRWRSRALLALAAPAVAGAGLVVALGLVTGVFESGPSDADVRAAYTAGSAEGGEAGLAAARAEREAAAAASALSTAGGVEASRSSAAFETWLAAQRAQGNDPVYEALRPSRVPVDGDPGTRAVFCDQSRCVDVESGLSVHVITLQGWFDPNRTGRQAPVIAAGAGAAVSNEPAAPPQAPTRIGERLICDQNQCTDTVTGASVSLIRIRGWFNPSGLEGGAPTRAAEGQTQEASSDAGANFLGSGGDVRDGVGGDDLARSLKYDAAVDVYAPRRPITSGGSGVTTSGEGVAYGDSCGAPDCARIAAEAVAGGL